MLRTDEVDRQPTRTTDSAHLISTKLFYEFCRRAGQAPSPDNNQPWLFRHAPQDDAIEVHHCRKRALPSDAGDSFSWIAVGAALENLVLAASQEGLTSTVEYMPRPFDVVGEGERVARVQLVRGGRMDPLAEHLRERVTNRRLYRRSRVSDEKLTVLESAIADSRCDVLWLTDRPRLKQLSRLVRVADQIRFEHRPFHDEFHSVLRYGDAEARRTGDGLELKSLEVPSIAGPVFRGLKPWARMRLANRFGMSRMFSGYSAKQIVRSGAVGLLVARERSDECLLEAGRAFQRVWLAATQQRLAFQPVGGLPLFLTKLAVEGESAFTTSHAARLQPLAGELEKLFPAARDNVPVMLFRIGHADPPTARSYRYETDKIVLP